MTTRICIFVLCLCAHVHPRAQTPAATYQDILRKFQEGAAIRVVLIGNSVAQGYYATGWENIKETAAGDPRGRGKLTVESQIDASIKGVATQLRALLVAKNANSVLVNESGDGWDSSMMLGLTPKAPGEAPVDTIGAVIAATPAYDIALVPLEVNDLGHGLPFATYQANLRTIVQRLKDANIVPVLVKENDISREGWPAYMAEIDVIAGEKSISTIDGYTPFHAAVVAAGGLPASNLMHDNDLHPNQAGHDLLFTAYAAWFNQSLLSTASIK